MWIASLTAAVGATEPSYSEIVQKLDRIIGEQLAADHHAASRDVRLDDITARLDNLTSAIDALEQRLLCPAGWRRINNSCYVVPSQQANTSDGERACDRHAPGAHLASVHAASQQEMKALLASSGREEVWLGLRRAGDGWAWSDGSGLDVTDWDQEEPDNRKNEDCGYWVSSSGKWKDGFCRYAIHIMCQLDLAA